MNRFASLCFLCVLCGESFSAPPAVTSLFPAGGQRGTVVDATVAGTFDTWPVHAWSSESGIQVVAEKEKGKFRVALGPAVVPGVYWLRFYDAAGASALRPFVVGTLPEVTEKEPNDEPAKAQPVAGNVVVNGKLEKSGDVDCYAVPLKKGQTLVAALDAHQSLRSPMDAVLQIASPDGTVLAQNNDYHGLDPLIAFPAPADGTYVVRLFAFPSTPDSSIRFFGSDACVYRLTLTTGPYADYPTPLAVAQGHSEVSIHGWNAPTLAKVGHADAGFAPVWHPAVANPLRVRAEPHACFDATVPGPLPVLTPPVSVTGRLNKPNQIDIIPVTLKKGTPLTIAVESASYGLPVAAVVRVLDPAGKPVTRVEPRQLHEDTTFPFTPTADGTYGIEVRDLYAAGDDHHLYLLRVVPAEPEFALTTATDRLTLIPGKPLDVPVTLAKLNGFDGDVALTAEGLPPGVTAASAPPPAKPDGKTITLRLTAEPMTWSGPVRLVGTAKGRARPVRAANADFAEPTADLWLTVSPDASPTPPTKPKKK
jgi:hypothetical protein